MPTPASDKKDRILDAARRLLVERGFQDILLDDVAREAGVAKGTLFLYYDSKDALVAAVFAGLVDQLAAELDAVAASGREGPPLLEETARVILLHFDRNSDFLSQFGVGRFPACGTRSCGKLMDKFSENLRRVADILARCGDGGRPLGGDRQAAAAVLFGLCRSAFVHRALTGGRAPLAGRASWVTGFFLHGAEGLS